MHAENRVEFLLGHFVKDCIPQIAGIIHYTIDAAVQIEGLLDDFLCRVPVGDAVGVGCGDTTGALDLVDSLLCRPGASAGPIQVCPDIIPEYLRTLPGGPLSYCLADAATGAGHDDGLSFKNVHCGIS